MNILSRIMEVVRKMFTKASVAEKVGADIAVSSDMLNAIKEWSDLYENKASWLTDKYKGKHLPSAIAHEMARLVTLEMKSELTGDARAKFLSPFYEKTVEDAPCFVEYACAKGGLMLKPYLAENNVIATAYVQADFFYPTAYDNAGNITGCIFIERKTIGKKYYTRLEVHSFAPNNYIIKNQAYYADNPNELGRNISLTTVPEWSMLQEETILTGFKRPLYCYFKMPGANRIDSNSPLGMSVFSNAIDAIQNADEQYARLLWEFEGSELAVNVDEQALEYDVDKKPRMPKLNSRLYRALDTGMDEFYQVFSPTIREQSLLNGLDAILRDVEYLSGLAFGTFSRQQDTSKTATEIKASKQRSYCTVSAIQKSLKNCLTDYVECLNELCDLYNLAPAGATEQSFEFDDSLVTDSETEQKIWTQELVSGVMGPIEYRMRRYGETEEQAKKMLPAAINDGDTPPIPINKSEVEETAEKVTGERLNGAQVKSLMEVITQYSNGSLSEIAATNIIVSAFGISESEARKLLGLGDK